MTSSSLQRYNPAQHTTLIEETLLAVTYIQTEVRVAISYCIAWLDEFIFGVLPIITTVELANMAIRGIRFLNLPSEIEREVFKWLVLILQKM